MGIPCRNLLRPLNFWGVFSSLFSLRLVVMDFILLFPHNKEENGSYWDRNLTSGEQVHSRGFVLDWLPFWAHPLVTMEMLTSHYKYQRTNWAGPLHRVASTTSSNSTFNIPLYKKEHMAKLLGAQVWLSMYMAVAQCKTLVLNTDICTHRRRQKILGILPNPPGLFIHTCGVKWPLSFYFL